jgi:hypothetical protein
MKQILTPLAGGMAIASLVLAVPRGQSRADAGGDAHAYYLFLAEPPKGCEICYVPLLVTTRRLEDLAKERADEQCLVITTYERDSIVGPPKSAKVLARDIRPAERYVRVLDRLYRYQEISAGEVLTLLEHPEGKIPISRIPQMRIPSVDELADLTARFRALK